MKQKFSTTSAVLATALAMALAALAWLGAQRLIDNRAGAWPYAPEDAQWLLSERARDLVQSAYADLPDDAAVVDHWVQALSLGQGTAGETANRSYINPAWLSWTHPFQRMRARTLFAAAGITDITHADKQYLARLLRLARALPAGHRLHLVAADQRFDSGGRPQPEGTGMAVDNDYVQAIAQAHPDLIEPVVSVHPHRVDAVEALSIWAERGVRAVAWMPMRQNIDPAADDLDDYYRALADHDMTLYTRTGAARGPGADHPAYGDPMRYRAALDAGVRVMMVHVSGERRFPLPDAEGDANGAALLLQLLRNPEYAENLRVALAGVTRSDRAEGLLTTWLQNPQVADQLVYASDYPRSAIAANVDLTELADSGFVTTAQARALDEIRRINPLLFDFVLKRTLRLPYTDLGLPVGVFTRELP